jgi:hypothetical protein
MNVRRSCFLHGDHEEEHCPKCPPAVVLSPENKQLAASFEQIALACDKGAEAIEALRKENERLTAGLKFYADGHHFMLSDAGAWDSVTGEPENWQCDEEGTATVEDGTIAKQVLAGHTLRYTDQGELELEPPPATVTQLSPPTHPEIWRPSSQARRA